MFIGGILALGALATYGLDATGNLPPPPLTATSCIDEKLKFVREHDDTKPDLLAVGSSVTWRNLDFSTLKETDGFVQPLNGAPCYVMIHQIAWLTEFYLDHMPSVRTVVSVLAMRDFESCQEDAQLFDPMLGRGLVFNHAPTWLVYFVNFRPMRLASTAREIKAMRQGIDPDRTLVMDEFGSGPLAASPPDPRDDVVVSSDCLESLRQMARMMQEREIEWLVVLMPPMPAWQKRYDPDGKRDAAWRTAVTQTLRPFPIRLVDGRESPFLEDRYFVDPAHFNWQWSGEFTRWLFNKRAALVAAGGA